MNREGWGRGAGQRREGKSRRISVSEIFRDQRARTAMDSVRDVSKQEMWRSHTCKTGLHPQNCSLECDSVPPWQVPSYSLPEKKQTDDICELSTPPQCQQTFCHEFLAPASSSSYRSSRGLCLDSNLSGSFCCLFVCLLAFTLVNNKFVLPIQLYPWVANCQCSSSACVPLAQATNTQSYYSS